MNQPEDLTRILDQETIARAHAIASRNSHMHEMRCEINSLRRRILFWRVLAIGMILACILITILAK